MGAIHSKTEMNFAKPNLDDLNAVFHSVQNNIRHTMIYIICTCRRQFTLPYSQTWLLQIAQVKHILFVIIMNMTIGPKN